MGVSGGTLYRLLNDSFHLMLEQSLSDLGWFDSNRRHRPVTLLPEPVEDDVHVEPNLVTVSVDEVSPKYVELGSTFAEHRVRAYVDIYGESKALALSLMGDIKDIVDGRIVSIGREFPTFSVLDLRAATPSELFVCGIENVSASRERFYSKPFEKYWWFVECDLVFAYHSDALPI